MEDFAELTSSVHDLDRRQTSLLPVPDALSHHFTIANLAETCWGRVLQNIVSERFFSLPFREARGQVTHHNQNLPAVRPTVQVCRAC